MGRTLSAVDIGSNTVHLLVGEIEEEGVKRIRDESDWLSLGEIVGRERAIPRDLQSRLIGTLSEFKRLSKDAKSEGIYVFATEAMRRADNGKEVLKRIQDDAGISVDIISGPREIELALRGATIDSDRSGPLLLVDVGGGSAQIALCSRKRVSAEASLPLGTGTLTARLGLTSPCDYVHVKRIQRAVAEMLETAEVFGDYQSIVACGGVARGLVRALHPDGDRELQIEELDYLIWATQRLDFEMISSRFNVKSGRAATLLPGAIVYKMVMERAGIDEMVVSRFGVREGAIREMAQGKLPICRV